MAKYDKRRGGSLVHNVNVSQGTSLREWFSTVVICKHIFSSFYYHILIMYQSTYKNGGSSLWEKGKLPKYAQF